MLNTMTFVGSFINTIRVIVFFLTICSLCSDSEESFEDSSSMSLEDIYRNEEDSSEERSSRILTEGGRTKRAQMLELPTSLGVAVGSVETTDGFPNNLEQGGRRLFAFRGIPYAKPPIGSLRWRDPEPYGDRWEGGHLDATRFQNFCVQWNTNSNAPSGNEDCLYLNVYTPVLPDSRVPQLPVLVFIHGGAYIRGSSHVHGPNRLLREDIILVTMNYRLGVFGFLSTDDTVVPGNYGLLDQLEAMKWVQKHIAEFGGNPDAVTLGGFSAGSSFVHFHLLSPQSQGLFHRAIMASGAANCLWSEQEDPWAVATELADDLGCSSSSSRAMKECLLLKDANSLINAQQNRQKFVYWPFNYAPVVDRNHRENPFLSAPVRELMNEPYPSVVPVLIGTVPEEGLLFALTTMMFNGDSSSPGRVYQDAFPYIFESLWPNQTSREEVARSLMSFYFTENTKKNANTFVADLTEAMSDVLFTSCVWDAASSLTDGFVYSYLMTHHEPGSRSVAANLYDAARSVGVTSPLMEHAVSHGDDMELIFTKPHPEPELTQGDQQMSRILTAVWGSFVKTGSPQDGSAVAASFPRWEPCLPGETLKYYRLSLSPFMIDRPFRYKERNLWKQVLSPVEEAYQQASVGWSWEIAGWVLTALVLLLFFLLILIVLMWRKSKRHASISHSPPTLRRQMTKASPMRER